MAVRNPALTGIRGFAALWVVLYHIDSSVLGYFNQFMPAHTSFPFIGKGYLGVDLFFLLSGMIMAMTYGESLARPTLPALRRLAIGRAFRILPLHWLALGGLAMLIPLMNGRWLSPVPHNFENAFLSAALIQTWVGRSAAWNVPAWSLSAEWLAYGFLPAFAMIVMRISKRWQALGLAATSLLALGCLFVILENPNLNSIMRLGIARCLFEFFAGMLTYRALSLCPLSAKQGNLCLLLGSVFLAAAMPHSLSDFPALAGFTLLLASFISPATWPQRLFGNRVAYFLGEISYSIYILQWILLEFYRGALKSGLLVGKVQATTALLAIPVVLIPLSWATWRWIEKPCQRAGKNLARWFEKPDDDIAAAGQMVRH